MKRKQKSRLTFLICIACAVVIGIVALAVFVSCAPKEKPIEDPNQVVSPSDSGSQADAPDDSNQTPSNPDSGSQTGKDNEPSDTPSNPDSGSQTGKDNEPSNTPSNPDSGSQTGKDNEPSNTPANPDSGSQTGKNNEPSNTPTNPDSGSQTGKDNEPAPVDVPFDLFAYCKDFAIATGVLNGDYCTYQQPSTNYGGYEGEYFSISYWAGYDKVEFCLHCPLSETLSHNFYLTMRGGFDGKYEYSSSKYYRDNGESLRFASGIIDPYTFTSQYPISCDVYEGSADGQNEFMEESRIGICDLIDCLKAFVTVENMDCDFSDFGFVHF